MEKLPFKDGGSRKETGSESAENEDVSFLDDSFADGFVQQDGTGCGG